MSNDSELKQLAKTFEDKLKKIKICLFDVDGILTDGKIYWMGDDIGFTRSYFIQDGYGMKLLQRAGFKVGIITAGNSKSVQKRVEQLGLDFLYMGNEDKTGALDDVLKKYGCTDEEFLYMGDDLFDIPLLRRAGFAATVKESSDEVREICHYTAKRGSGQGCVREVIDILRYAQNIDWESLQK